VVASPLDYSIGEMLSFVRRQYMVAKYYVPDWWLFAMAASTFTNVVWLGSLAVVGGSLIYGAPPVWIPLCGSAVLYLLGVCRGWLRQDLVGNYFPDWRERLRNAGRFDVWANPLARFVHWLGVLGSLFGRHISWRGVSYRVFPGGQIRIAGRDDEGPFQEPETATKESISYRKAS
jgi:hypothetical protein